MDSLQRLQSAVKDSAVACVYSSCFSHPAQLSYAASPILRLLQNVFDLVEIVGDVGG